MLEQGMRDNASLLIFLESTRKLRVAPIPASGHFPFFSCSRRVSELLSHRMNRKARSLTLGAGGRVEQIVQSSKKGIGIVAGKIIIRVKIHVNRPPEGSAGHHCAGGIVGPSSPIRGQRDQQHTRKIGQFGHGSQGQLGIAAAFAFAMQGHRCLATRDDTGRARDRLTGALAWRKKVASSKPPGAPRLANQCVEDRG